MPGLLTLTTDLKSLKYGADRPGGGSSEQPYIINDINNPTNVLGFDDGLVRGGAVGAAQSGLTDTIRIGKFFLNNPLFIVKQVGLQFSNPRLEVPKDPANILMGGLDNILAVGTKGLLEPTRIYNLGINTIAQVPVNAFGAHFNRHGLLPIQTNASKYEAVATANNESHNRLVKLTNKFDLGVNKSNVKPKSNLLGGLIGLVNSVTGLNIPNIFQNKELIIDQYLGGPGSAYGIGGTIINRTSFTDTSGYKNSNGSGKSFITKDFIKPSDNLDFGNPNFTNYISARTASIFADPVHNWTEMGLLVGLDVDENLRATLDDYIPNDYIYAPNFFYGIAPNSQGRGVDNENDINLLNGPSSHPLLSTSSLGSNNLNLPHTKYGKDATYVEVYNTNEANKSYHPSKDQSLIYAPPAVDYIRQLGVSNDYFDNTNGLFQTQSNQIYNGIINAGALITTPFSAVQYTATATPAGKYFQLQSQINKDIQKYATKEYKNVNAAASSVFNQRIIGELLPGSSKSPITYTNTYGEKYVIDMGWREATRERRVGSGRKDQINLTPIFEAEAGTHKDVVKSGLREKNNKVKPRYPANINDLVKFRIQALDVHKPTNALWMIFRAYITDLSDNVDAEWTDVKYAGRGDKFYIYSGFSRKMSVSFKVAALSIGEMEPMYQKLNFLMSNLMPDYSEVGDTVGVIMKGPMMRMTIGNYIDGQLCVLNSLSYKISNDTPWEIGLGDKELILPHIIEVTLNFTPIGSQTRNENRLSRKTDGTSHIAQQYNGGPGKRGAGEREYIYRDEKINEKIPPEPTPPPTPPAPLPPVAPLIIPPVVFKPANDTPYRTTQAAGVTPGQLDQRLLINQFKKKK
jgi:hypothetical protein